ncbi:gamma-butyrobetaine hydroxylase-like domain-containing protein [Noviherbaspirillum album]|uniref:gamma-butyrobetaine hydroxylase-like domain-containing protein n=1 Tax=Noviherbaspirillum album TaxID=3080276 RepID=UPI0034602A1C
MASLFHCRYGHALPRSFSSDSCGCTFHLYPVGACAMQLVFSDGHRQDIFPWAYLQELCESGKDGRAVS